MTVHSAIYNLLSQGWYAPHEVGLQLRLQGIHCAAEAVTARMRDLRKVRFGGYKVNKQIRPGTDYYEYRIEEEQEKAA